MSYEVATRFDWATDATGLHNGCCMLRLRPADMIKFGELYLQEGIWHGHQTWMAKGWGGQVIAVIPEHRLVVAVASVPTDAAGYIDGNSAWHLVADTVVSALP